MSKFKVGYRGKFLSPKSGYATIIKEIDNVSYPLVYEFSDEPCPHCQKKIKKEKTFNIDKILVLEYDDGTIGYKGMESDGETIIRMPEGAFQSKCKDGFINKIKELDNGNTVPDKH